MTPSETVAWLHDEMVRIESHWTDQIQNQQRRIAAVLAVNGFLLAFLAAAGLGANSHDLGKGWYLYPFYMSLFFLSIALIFGMVVLIPRVPIGGAANRQGATAPDDDDRTRTAIPSETITHWFSTTYGRPTIKPPSPWLDSHKIFDEVERSLDRSTLTPSDSVVLEVARSAGGNQDWNRNLQMTNERRRRWLNWEMTFILLGIVSLIVTVVGSAQHAIS
jgi:hypothetical protein